MSERVTRTADGRAAAPAPRVESDPDGAALIGAPAPTDPHPTELHPTEPDPTEPDPTGTDHAGTDPGGAETVGAGPAGGGGADGAEAVGAETPDAGAGGLTDRERAILDFERRWWRHPGAKEQAVLETFALSATRYYQVLRGLVDKPAAVAYDPVLVSRLRRLRARRTRARGGPIAD
ncbi:hypothetical protein GCM10010123_21020 [Pilimelia anulata]|uniref:DUF3263 domain-containing protein n=1 Tax=Pilimelia anulata TaxID=53371 RepID=A0A8J3B7E0_9ACTN|nr:DUF3263 domain-containing protein [Pilimelia anulata]GGJ90942.1 hypothetical protein GCM10010123_21020 [Pilimelia anulata]